MKHDLSVQGVARSVFFLLVAAPLAMNVQFVVAQTMCNSQKPDQTPLSCDGAYTRCEDNNPSICPDPTQASCMDLTGKYPEKVPTSCESGEPQQHCDDGDDVVCYTMEVCHKIEETPGNFKCVSNETVCSQSLITQKELFTDCDAGM